MRLVAVRNAALRQLEKFKTEGSLGSKDRIQLIEPAVNGERNRLTDEFISTQESDGKPGDLAPEDGLLVTSRGPSERESIPRRLDTETRFQGDLSKGESSRHELAKAWDDREPYQETFEHTRFQDGGISHVSVTIQGDAVGTGGILTMAEYLSPEPGQSWRERSFQGFTSDDALRMYKQGTYQPKIDGVPE